MESVSDIISGVGSYTAPGVRMSKKELDTVSGAILTDHPDAKCGSRLPYEYGNHFYVAAVLEVPGNYYFIEKIQLTPKNQPKINYIRKGLMEYE